MSTHLSFDLFLSPVSGIRNVIGEEYGPSPTVAAATLTR